MPDSIDERLREIRQRAETAHHYFDAVAPTFGTHADAVQACLRDIDYLLDHLSSLGEVERAARERPSVTGAVTTAATTAAWADIWLRAPGCAFDDALAALNATNPQPTSPLRGAGK